MCDFLVTLLINAVSPGTAKARVWWWWLNQPMFPPSNTQESSKNKTDSD